MSDHPSTYEGDPEYSEAIAWDDHAMLVPVERKDGVLTRLASVRSGTFAEMIRGLVALEPGMREGYVIEKAGDREYSSGEAMALSARDDFPQTASD